MSVAVRIGDRKKKIIATPPVPPFPQPLEPTPASPVKEPVPA